MQDLSNNPKYTASVTSTQKIQTFGIQNPQNTLVIPVCKYANSTPLGFVRRPHKNMDLSFIQHVF